MESEKSEEFVESEKSGEFWESEKSEVFLESEKSEDFFFSLVFDALERRIRFEFGREFGF